MKKSLFIEMKCTYKWEDNYFIQFFITSISQTQSQWCCIERITKLKREEEVAKPILSNL